MIDLENLRFQYPRSSFELSIPQLKIFDGEKIAILGASGSGKSTLLRLIAGVEIPSAGMIRVDGTCVNQLEDKDRRRFRASQIGFVFQEFELIDYLKVRENIMLPFLLDPRIQRTDLNANDELNRLAKQTSITELLNRHPRNLSHGERQRVAICRALVTRPKLLLADEPTGSLDGGNAERVLNLLMEESASRKVTLVVVTHDRSLLSRFDRVLEMPELVQP